MESYEVLLSVPTPGQAGTLARWLTREGYAAGPVMSPGHMGTSETLAMTVTGASSLRAALALAREWVWANRVSISVSINGRGKVTVDGTTDIDHLLAVLTEPKKEAGQ